MPSTKSPTADELLQQSQRQAAQLAVSQAQRPKNKGADRNQAGKPPSLSELAAERVRREGGVPLDLDGKLSLIDRMRLAAEHAGNPVKGARK